MTGSHDHSSQQYGRTFSLALQPSEPAPTSVPERIRFKLALYTPGRELVDAYLYEIARGYNVDWTPEPPADKETEQNAPATSDGASGDDEPGGGVGERIKEAMGEAGEESDKVAEEERKEPAGEGKTAEYPVDTGKDAWADSAPLGAAPSGGAKATAGTKKLTPEEELALRFERLKNLR